MKALLARIRDLLRAEPVVVSTVVTVIVAAAARYGFSVDPNVVLAVMAVVLGVTNTVARGVVTSPATMDDLRRDHQASIATLRGQIQSSLRNTETDR